MTMNSSTLNTISSNMGQQKRYVKEILDLIDECSKQKLIDPADPELQHLKNHCEAIDRASDAANKLVDLLRPTISKEKSKDEAEAEKKPAKKSTKKKSEPKPEPEPVQDEEDFLD